MSKNKGENLGKEINIDELKKLQIDILDTVVEFCNKNNINYWLDCGTLLGAIRHNGYIPWDDDIDIGMLRPDFDKFMKKFNTENKRYKFYCYENNHDFLYPFGKVLDTSTVLYEPDKKGNKLAVYIDVFVYDNAPDDDKEVKKIFDNKDKYLMWQKIHGTQTPHGNIIRRSAVRFVRALLLVLPKGYFVNKMVKNAKSYSTEKTKRVAHFTGFTKVVCEKEVFDNFSQAQFEGKYYKVPSGYDKWLTCFYGDYMKLPPEEKRVPHHRFEAYFIENSSNNNSK